MFPLGNGSSMVLLALLIPVLVVDFVESCDGAALLCRKCGQDIVKAEDITKVVSRLAQGARNQTLLGVPEVRIQRFQNPNEEEFDVFTTKYADVMPVGDAHPEDSWFPGYSWTIAVCPKCGSHLGWTFSNRLINSMTGEIVKDQFHVSDSLTMIPKIGYKQY